MAVTVEGDDLFIYRIGSEEVVISGETIEQLINNLEVKHPGFRDDVLSDSGKSFRENVIVAVNGTQARTMGQPLSDGDKVYFSYFESGG
jgi:molybdopterin converting factor small subunit